MSAIMHIQSVMVAQHRIRSVVRRWKDVYSAQAVWHYEEIDFGGKKRFGGLGVDRAEKKYLIANLQTSGEGYDSTPQWEIVDAIDKAEINSTNVAYVDEHIDRWMTPAEAVCKSDHGNRIDPWTVDSDRMGLYAVYSRGDNVLRYMVQVSTQSDLFTLFDRVERFASNFHREELVDMGYLTVAEHTSWLGAGGSHVHAVEAYFRDLTNRYVYFSLDTWCTGNYWLSAEHSPSAIYPTADKVNCKKCLKKMALLASHVESLSGIAEHLESQKKNSGWGVQGRYQGMADLVKQVVEVLQGQAPAPLRSISEYVADEARVRDFPVPDTTDPDEDKVLDPTTRLFVYQALKRISAWMTSEAKGWQDKDAIATWRQYMKQLSSAAKALGSFRHP